MVKTIMVLVVVSCITITQTVHFNGGTIRWQPVDPHENSNSVTITIVQTYYWTYPTIICSTNVPISTPLRQDTAVNLTCIADCLTDGGYSSNMITMVTDCVTASLSIQMMTSQRSVNVTISADAHFYLAFQGIAWRDLNDPIQQNLPWSMVSLIDIRKRSDNIINTSPVGIVSSPQFAAANRITPIRILVSDENEGDDIRCRWAENFSISPTDECGGSCFPASIPTGSNLSNCTLFFWGVTAGVWYAATIQVEDFINTTSVTPMSSVPVQFLIYVTPTPSCSDAPIIFPLTGCFQVTAGVLMSVNISVLNLCDPNIAQITNMITTQSSAGMTISSLQQSTTNISIFYQTLTWTPQTNQIGAHQLCMIAYTNESLQSLQYCVIFTVIESTDLCATTTVKIVTTEVAQKSSDELNWGLIGGQIAAGVVVLLCCCSWCCLYFLCWSPAARQRRQQKNEDEKKLKCSCQNSMSIKSSTATQTAEPNDLQSICTNNIHEQPIETIDTNQLTTHRETIACSTNNESKQMTTKSRSFIINRHTYEQSKARLISLSAFDIQPINDTTSPPPPSQLETTIKNESSRQINTINIDFDDWARIYLFGTQQITGLSRIHHNKNHDQRK